MTGIERPHPALSWCRALRTVASLQQSNLDTGLCFLRLAFGATLRLHVRWGAGPVREVEVGLDVGQDELGGRLATMGPVAVAWAPPGEALWLPEPGSPPMRVYAWLLDCLGSLPSAWMHYAPRALSLREVSTDGLSYADVAHTDTEAGQVLVTRVPLTAAVEPGIAFELIDLVCDDGRTAVTSKLEAAGGLPAYVVE